MSQCDCYRLEHLESQECVALIAMFAQNGARHLTPIFAYSHTYKHLFLLFIALKKVNIGEKHEM